MVRVRWTREAKRWLREIHDYIACDSPTAAKKTVRGIIAKTEILKTFPDIGYRYDIEVPIEVRVIYYTHYRIAYRIGDADLIDIVGVFHGAMEIKRYIRFES